jgi:hypothetical protein
MQYKRMAVRVKDEVGRRQGSLHGMKVLLTGV